MLGCEMCRGLRGHARLEEVLRNELEVQRDEAWAEVERLQTLFDHSIWYNFEVTASSWKHPWYLSWLDSWIGLETFRSTTQIRNGRSREVIGRRYWFSGAIKDAPKVPISIIHESLFEAIADAKVLDDAVRAVTEYAPDGERAIFTISSERSEI